MPNTPAKIERIYLPAPCVWEATSDAAVCLACGAGMPTDDVSQACDVIKSLHPTAG